MKNYAAFLFGIAYLAATVEGGSSACPFFLKKSLCEDKGKQYDLQDSSDGDCKCRCKWTESDNECNVN